MHSDRLNAPLLRLESSHPARLFLEAFLECQRDCLGQQYPPPTGKGIDQQWYSHQLGREYSYSEFMYERIAFDITLDGWLTNSPFLTESEKALLIQIPQMKSLLFECLEAARSSNNHEILPLVNQTLQMLDLWEKCIRVRPTQDAL